VNVSLNTYIYYRPYPGQGRHDIYSRTSTDQNNNGVSHETTITIEQMNGLSEFIVDRFPHVSHLWSNEKGLLSTVQI